MHNELNEYRLDRRIDPFNLNESLNGLEIPFFVVVQIHSVFAVDQAPQCDEFLIDWVHDFPAFDDNCIVDRALVIAIKVEPAGVFLQVGKF